MKRIRRTQIVIENDRLLLISRRANQLWCGVCGTRVKMIDSSKAALLLGVTQRRIFQAVETGLIHFAETTSGDLLICCASIKSVDWE